MAKSDFSAESGSWCMRSTVSINCTKYLGFVFNVFGIPCDTSSVSSLTPLSIIREMEGGHSLERVCAKHGIFKAGSVLV